MPNTYADVVTIGESMILFQPMNAGPLLNEPLFVKSVAGAESNVAIGLSRLGHSVRWIGSLGADPFGEMILSTLRGQGIDTSYAVQNPDAPTAVYFKEAKPFGDPKVYYYRKGSAASQMTEADVQAEWFDGAGHLHVTGITPALGAGTAGMVRRAMTLAREKGLTVSFDPNLRRKLWSEEAAREALLSLIPLCDVFLPGLEEAEFLLGKATPEEYGARFLAMGPRFVALKLGEEGSLGFAGDQVFAGAPYKVKGTVDTVGAGDAYAAGLLSAFVRHKDKWSAVELAAWVPQALQKANTMGALATQFKGDWEGLPTIRELEQLLAGNQEATR